MDFRVERTRAPQRHFFETAGNLKEKHPRKQNKQLKEKSFSHKKTGTVALRDANLTPSHNKTHMEASSDATQQTLSGFEIHFKPGSNPATDPEQTILLRLLIVVVRQLVSV